MNSHSIEGSIKKKGFIWKKAKNKKRKNRKGKTEQNIMALGDHDNKENQVLRWR